MAILYGTSKRFLFVKTSILVQNIKCNACANTIKSELIKVIGVTDISVDKDTFRVSFSAKDINSALLAKSKLKALGYPSIDSKNSIVSKAKSYMSCVSGKIKK